MANSYHRGSSSPADLFQAIQTFLKACRAPAVLEYGEQVMPLRQDEFMLEVRADRLWIDVWHENKSLSRRILSIEGRGNGVLDCSVHRFGGTCGKLSFLDLDRPQTAQRQLAGSRRSFGEQFRRMLQRQLPGWELRSLSAAMDLQRSFSPLFPRARLTRGQHQIAAVACPDAAHETAFLTFALLWFDHLRGHSLHLFLPEGAGTLTAHRLRWLARGTLRTKLFLFNEHGAAGEVDPDDLGNLDTAVKSRFQAPQLPPDLEQTIRTLAAREQFGICPELTGALSIRFQGHEFARIEDGRLFLGLDTQEEVINGAAHRLEEFAGHMRSVATQLKPEPERWLESAVRENLMAVDPELRQTPVHSQVLSIAGRDRDALDLLAISHDGRLTILELKADQDILLPMQALDYWARVVWHNSRRELRHLFPGVELQTQAPRLLLVAPAISFHPANQTVLRYFSPEIDVQRVGISSDWQTNLKVVLRLNRGDGPQSHENFA